MVKNEKDISEEQPGYYSRLDLSKIYFNICNGSITYLATKTVSHNFSVQEKCILKSIFLKDLKIARDS